MFREGLRPPNPFAEADPFEQALTQDGISLKAFSGQGPLLVVCLPAKKRATNLLAKLAQHRSAIEQTGTRIVLVHREHDPRAALEPHDLAYVARIADPDGALYAALGLEQKRSLLGTRQQAGAFVMRDGEIVRALGKKPDFSSLE